MPAANIAADRTRSRLATLSPPRGNAAGTEADIMPGTVFHLDAGGLRVPH